ncbi:putative alpha-1,3-mannosyltransferase [Aureobasidium pullulans]|uniref:Putative alpha-1,3-mannosyltransferase n=1 Tax=Aureobasidium pullulans TaxID=5580 RepID=A0A4T0BNL5_AURPU|nr:putative alpha-1,3-mannosyltransferase [Aureobasidium pullulans]
MTLMPSELSMKALMAPFVDTGDEHLKDVATRVRIFRAAFEAWEDLHGVASGDQVGFSNILQRLRNPGNSAIDIRNAIQRYDEFRYYVNRLGITLFPGTNLAFGDHLLLHASFYKAGRGIVLTLGDHQVYMVLTSIRAFRRMGCTLPIEIMYLGEEDLGEEFRVMLEEIPGVITRDLSIMVDDQGWELKGWAMKPWAVLMSSFQEVLFMDADVLFFVDPETLFEDPQYQATGALFFKDRNLGREEKRKWLKKVLPSPISGKVKENRLWTGESGHMQDSGIVVIDKWVHFVPVLLATRLNGIDRDGNSDTGKKGVYEMVYGDKETFWLSWEMAGVYDYAFHSGPTGILGILKEPEAERSLEPDGGAEETDTQEGDQSSRVSAKVTKAVSPQNHTACSPQLLHLGNTGRPLWLNGWISQNKFSAPNDVDIDNFQVFLKEPVKKNPSSKTEMWELEENNVCCLTVDSFTEISKDDKHALEVMILLAKEYEWEV